MSDAGVSVVMAAFDAEAYIGDALRSALQQTLPPLEIIVVDDGSRDGTADIAESIDPRVRVLRMEHRGAGASRNEAVRAARADLLAFLDADDLWAETKLERQVAALQAFPHLEAAFCLIDEFIDETAPPPSGTRPPRTGQAVPLSVNALLRASLVRRLGPFDPTLGVGDWLDFWSRARAMSVTEYFVPEVLALRRIHGRNNSMTRGDQGQSFLRIARQHLAQRRADSEGGPGGGR